MIKTIGSVCSGIEAASVAFIPCGLSVEWFSEIADFPSKVLKEKFPDIPNLGDMNLIPNKIINKEIKDTDMICGGTPCQAFSFAGLKDGLKDDRGNLTLKFIDIIEANDKIRLEKEKNRTIVFWENVEGILSDKTNAFGCFIGLLSGANKPLTIEGNKWPKSGLIRGSKRNIAWRVLDAKYFGVPQQRKRIYLIAGGKDFYPENILFEEHTNILEEYPSFPLKFKKNGSEFEIFRSYTDCLYSSYGTKWNGNAAAYNGSLFVVQDNRIRRLSPLECERLMGFPDNYTNIEGAKKTNRYNAIGNSWAVPVIKWLGKRLVNINQIESIIPEKFEKTYLNTIKYDKNTIFYNFGKDIIKIGDIYLNCTSIPEKIETNSLETIISKDATEDIYISPVGCYGILRRQKERNLKINPRLKIALESIASNMSKEEIERRSSIQKRGKLNNKYKEDRNIQLTLF